MTTNNHGTGRLLLTACLISFATFLGSYMRIPIVPLFATSLGADTVQVGLINGGFMLMAGGLSIPSGLLSDRLGRRLPILVAMLLLAASSLLLYWCRTPLQMGIIYLLFGIGLSAFSPTLMSYVADITPPELLGRAYGWYTMALYGGMTIGPAVGGLCGTTWGLRPVFLIAGGLICTMFLVALLLLSHPPAHQRNGTSPAILPALQSLLKNRRLVACLLATVGGCLGFGMFVTFMPLYIRGQGLSTGAVGLVFASQALSNALSRIPVGRMYDRITDRRLLVGGGLGVFGLALAGFALCRNLPGLGATAAVMGIGMGTAFTVICALIVEAVPRHQRGLAMGCYNTSIYAGMMLSSAGMGGVIRSAGYGTAFALSGSVVVTMLALFLAIYPGHREDSIVA